MSTPIVIVCLPTANNRVSLMLHLPVFTWPGFCPAKGPNWWTTETKASFGPWIPDMTWIQPAPHLVLQNSGLLLLFLYPVWVVSNMSSWVWNEPRLTIKSSAWLKPGSAWLITLRPANPTWLKTVSLGFVWLSELLSFGLTLLDIFDHFHYLQYPHNNFGKSNHFEMS